MKQRQTEKDRERVGRRKKQREKEKARACAGTTGLPQRAKKPVASEHHNRSQITDHRNVEKMGN